ncbi:MAG: type III-A CRISPR-associated protein Cas10/Csm1 [Candidatus Contendobacter sp.]|nr:type III-A CRISPR-associated protein Cas10/Csm1 [Candidatus Contendobacter sp.]MDG4558361.1 type III-A CRISPR-associated protein Cas10/Csm1 [Candidatus Contendobacter sp.]
MNDPQTLHNAEQRLRASCRVALAGLLHDLGKLAERAGLTVDSSTLEKNVHQYSPYHQTHPQDRGWFSHKHAAYTALAFDRIEFWLPQVRGETETVPFGTSIDDSLINAAARHHRPETWLQWVIATADRVASGFERSEFEKYNAAPDETSFRKNHYTARLLTLFEQIRLDDSEEPMVFQQRYRLKPMTPAALFPVPATDYEHDDKDRARQEYARLWEGFEQALAEIPASHREALPLWLDHFETLWACYASTIPSATAFNVKPDVSLYDHSKAVAALAVALWRYHHDQGHDPKTVRRALADRADWNEQKFLLIQGDCFGIQDFIFATGGETQKRAAKLLRGRSFYVSLLSECAALRVLEALDLPGTSQIINAAGKFLIVAPNTPETIDRLAKTQQELDAWFLTHSWGQSGIGLAWEPAYCNDFLKGSSGRRPFADLIKRLFQRLEEIKLRRFDLCGAQPPAPLFAGYLEQFSAHGQCQVDGRSPATRQIADGVWVSALAADQMAIGQSLTHRDRLLITRASLSGKALKSLATPIFGYHIGFTAEAAETGWFGPEARDGNLRRCWDISMPEALEQPLWNGCARRAINGYIPRFESENAWESDKYKGLRDEADFDPQPGEPKTLNHLACEDRWSNERQRWVGVEALMTLKGDVDNLGAIFQRGLSEPTFARMAALSRQLNAFFAVYLPALCQSQSEFRNTYTVFAGGDDFFLIGPWHSQIQLAARMRREFARYVAGNPGITFSAGLTMTKPGLPIRALGELAEDALEHAKDHETDPLLTPALKNAVCCFGQTVGWSIFAELLKGRDELERLAHDLKLSTGYLYGLLRLIDMAENLRSGRTDQRGKREKRMENALWHSRFVYRTRRLLERQKGMDEAARRRWQQEIAAIIASGIERFAGAYRIALFAYLYQQRD